MTSTIFSIIILSVSSILLCRMVLLLLHLANKRLVQLGKQGEEALTVLKSSNGLARVTSVLLLERYISELKGLLEDLEDEENYEEAANIRVIIAQNQIMMKRLADGTASIYDVDGKEEGDE